MYWPTDLPHNINLSNIAQQNGWFVTYIMCGERQHVGTFALLAPFLVERLDLSFRAKQNVQLINGKQKARDLL